MKRCVLLSSLFLMLLWMPETAAGQAFLTEVGRAEFRASSNIPMHNFTGTSEHLVGMIDLDEEIVDFYIDLTTVRTGIGRRDRDMRRALNTDDHPFAEFYGELTSSVDPSNSAAQSTRVRGDFTVHGVSREVEIEGILQMTDEGLRVEATWELNIRDHEINPPRLLFASVDDVVEIHIEALLPPHE